MIPDLLRVAPGVRPVLDRYGLRGCGGRWGPAESLGFFARAHDVPLDRLLYEIRQALRPAAQEPLEQPEPSEELADGIYRPFFRAGIGVVLTLGAAWGAYLLLQIATAGSFTAASLQEVNAHGHAQIFGWVGLFVMGFAYQAFPRFKHTSLSHPRLAYASLWLMLGGLIFRSVFGATATSWPWLGVPAVAGCVSEIMAIGIFLYVVAATARRSAKPLQAYDWYIFAALGWFLVQAVYGTLYFAATLLAAGREQLLGLVATWQAPLREIQIHGFAMLMILGVSQRLFHHFYGFPQPSRRKSFVALTGLNAAIVGVVAGLMLMGGGGHAGAAVWYLSVLLLAGSAGLLVSDWRIFSRPQQSDRSLKFLRAGYVWLFVSLTMLVLLPVYHLVLPAFAPGSAAAEMGFSHAYYGAIRHAVTVGFVSLMIVGVSSKVVPTLKGIDVHALRGLWVPFALINGGCALRVVSQTLADFTPAAFPVAGVTGFLELSGLAVWGIHLWRLMAGHAEPAEAPAAPPALVTMTPGGPITSQSIVGEVIDRYPWLLETFVSSGFKPLANPLLRRTVARRTTIEQACRHMGVDVQPLLEILNTQREQPSVQSAPASTTSE